MVSVVRLATKFCQEVDCELLKEEFEDLQLVFQCCISAMYVCTDVLLHNHIIFIMVFSENEYGVVSVVRLATQFCHEVNCEVLKEEFDDLQLLEDDVISTVIDMQQRRFDHVWGDVMALKTAMGVVRFHAITRVLIPLLGLLHINPECERVFSMVRKIHTDSRKSLLPETLTSYMQCKINFNACCYEIDVSAG